MSMVSNESVTSGQQLIYLTQWFAEFSELQKSDFTKHLIDKYSVSKCVPNSVTNGFNDLDLREKPLNIFECRMKLFGQWFIQWTDQLKEELISRLRNIDPEFMDEFEEKLKQINTNTESDDTVVEKSKQESQVSDNGSEYETQVGDESVDVEDSIESTQPLMTTVSD